jgi:ABC-2 type transport system ATP-binding protein
MRTARSVFVALFLAFALSAGLMSAHDSYSGGVPIVAAQASSAASSATVTNNVTVRSNSVSLGSSLEANGQVSADGRPLPNASVALHMGDVQVALAQTDQNGTYAFSVPVGAYYFPAAFSNGAAVYTVVHAQNSSFVDTPSAATTIPVNLAPLYAITALVTLAVVTILFLNVQRFRTRISVAVCAARPSKRPAAPVAASQETVKDLPQGLKSAPGAKAMSSASKPAEKAAPQPVIADEKHCHNFVVKNQPYAASGVFCDNSLVPAHGPATESERALPAKDAVDATALSQSGEPLGQGSDIQAIRGSDSKSAYVLTAQHLTKKIEDLLIVDDLNLEIKRREVFGFLGPNGAGKTTSIKMMVGLLKPTSGQVLFDGAELRSVEKEKIGVCPQDLVLWDVLTCRENLTYMGYMYGIPEPTLGKRVTKLLDLLSLSDKADQVVSKLSGGMKRRLNIALALVHNPEILFLDEPSAGLDPQSRLLLWDFIRSLRDDEGKTVVLTTHVMEEADALSDRIAIIDHGKLLLLDTPDGLKRTIGKGDIVDMQLADTAMNGEVLSLMESFDGLEEANEFKGRIVVRALDAANKLPGIMNRIESVGGRVSDISIRGNTLEDVFIYLTGRELRE